MELNQATVEQIPQVTKAEQEVNDLSSIQEAFGANQDVSGLDLNSRRTRKVQVNDIDEYIRQLEMETSLAETAKSGEDQNAIIQGGIFKPRYQMKINLVDEPPKAPQNGRRRNTNLDEDEVQAEPEPSMSAKSTQRTVEDRSFIQPRYDWKSKSGAKSSRFSRLSTRTEAYTRKSFDPQASPALYSECA